MLKSGDLFYYHPELSGDYETDRETWEVMETDIAKLNAHIAGRFTTKESARIIYNFIKILNDGKE
jgi:hypothetical protein